MAKLNNTDKMLVNRDGNSYFIETEYLKMAALRDTDLMLVNRSNTSYSITGKDVKESILGPYVLAEADGAISDGDPVILNPDETVSKVGGEASPLEISDRTVIKYPDSSSSGAYTALVYIDTNKVVYSNVETIRVGTVSGSGSNKTITWGAEAVHVSGINNPTNLQLFYNENLDRVVSFRTSVTQARGFEVSSWKIDGTTITRDDTKNVGYWQASWSVTEYDPVNDRYISFWTERTNTLVRYQYVGEITLELNTANPPKAIVDSTSNLYKGDNRNYYNNAIYRDPNTNNIGMIYSYGPASNVIQVGATVQNLTEQVIEDLDGNNLRTGNANDQTGIASFDPDLERFVYVRPIGGDLVVDVLYIDTGTLANSYAEIYGKNFLISGNVYALRSAPLGFNTLAKQTIVFYRTQTSENYAFHSIELYRDVEGNIKGNDTYAVPTIIEDDTVKYGNSVTFSGGLGPDNVEYLVAYYTASAAPQTSYYRWVTIPFVNSNLTTENFVGFSDGNFADGDTAKITTHLGINDAQSGLSADAQYFVNGDASLTTPDPKDPRYRQPCGIGINSTTIRVKLN